MKKQRKQWLAGIIAAVLTTSLLGGCGSGSGGNSTTAAVTAVSTTAAPATAAPSTAATASEETQAEKTESDLASRIRGNTNPSEEDIALVNATLDDSYLGDFYGLGSDYSVYDGRFDGVTLDIWMPSLYGTATIYPDLSQHPVFKQVSELTGIKLNFITPTVGEEKTEFNLMVSGGELPDIIVNWGSYYSGGLTAAEADGLIIDLTGYEDKLPNYVGYIKNGIHSDDLTVNTVLDDHRRLAVYEVYTGVTGIPYGPIIKAKAMEDAGWTDMPETIDDWHTFLTDCKNAGYDVPFVFGSSTGFLLSGYSCIASAYGVYSDLFINDEGKVAYGPVQDGLEGYLETMRQWYEEGLIDPDFATGDSAHRSSVTASDDCAVAFNSITSVASLLHGEAGKDVVSAQYPVLNKGDQPAIAYCPSFRASSNMAAVTTQCDNIDAALAFLDFAFSKKGWELYGLGSYGDVHLIDEDGRPYYPEDSLIYTDEEIVQYGGNYILSKYRLHHFICAYWDADSNPSASPAAKAAAEEWTWGSKMVALPAVSLTTEESSQIADISNNIATERNEYLLKIITGQLPVSAAAEFREQVKAMGLDTYVSVYQNAYDRYRAR